jgi:hypothetical protein
VELREEGLIRHIGVSNVTSEQVAEARSITSIVCVQNIYNLAYRHDDELIDALAAQGVAYVPFPARRIQAPCSRQRSRPWRHDMARLPWPSPSPGCCRRSVRSGSGGRRNVAPAALMRCLARLIRWAIVAAGTRSARAISAVVSPATARNVSASCDGADSDR